MLEESPSPTPAVAASKPSARSRNLARAQSEPPLTRLSSVSTTESITVARRARGEEADFGVRTALPRALRRLRIERDLARREASRHSDAFPTPDLEGRDAMWRLLQGLPHRQRAALVLPYYEDLSEEHTAEVLGCSSGAVNSLVSRAMGTLRKQLKATAHE